MEFIFANVTIFETITFFGFASFVSKTWNIVPPPFGKFVVGCQWVYGQD